MVFIKYLFVLLIMSFLFREAMAIIPLIFTEIGAVIQKKSENKIKGNNNSFLFPTILVLFSILLLPIYIYYTQTLLSTFYYFACKTYCQKHNMSNAWLYWVTSFVFPNYQLSKLLRGEDNNFGNYLLRLIPSIVFILAYFYPNEVMYPYQWLLQPIIDFLF